MGDARGVYIPMTNVIDCPECGGKTRHEHTSNVWNQYVEHVRTCRECPTQYAVRYAQPVIEKVETYD